VFTEAGRSYADVEGSLCCKEQSVGNIQGRTLQPDGKVVRFAGVIFDKVVAKYKKLAYGVKALTLPSVRVGSIIEYSYELHWKERLARLCSPSSAISGHGGVYQPHNYLDASAESFRATCGVLASAGEGRAAGVRHSALARQLPFDSAQRNHADDGHEYPSY
jgi:hypothetical protein